MTCAFLSFTGPLPDGRSFPPSQRKTRAMLRYVEQPSGPSHD
jgi:hypothetical protein